MHSKYIFAFLPKNLPPAPSVIMKHGVLHTTLLLIGESFQKNGSRGFMLWGLYPIPHIPQPAEAPGLTEDQ